MNLAQQARRSQLADLMSSISEQVPAELKAGFELWIENKDTVDGSKEAAENQNTAAGRNRKFSG